MTEAVRQVLADVPLLGTETLGLLDAVGRVAAEDVVATVAVPPWDNSAMDGYAVRSAEATAGAELPLVGVRGAGSPDTTALALGTAVAIMTGAPVPEGADSVVMVENTNGAESGTVRFLQDAQHARNIRRQGADIPAGSVVVGAGQRVTPARVGLLAAVGCTSVVVRRKPRIGVLATGDEVIRPGRPLGPGQIYSSNPYALVALFREMGAEAVDLGDAPDDLPGLVAALERGMHLDAVVTTGGVSVGRFDYVKEAFAAVGAEMGFWKVRMKPGKPLAFGSVVRGTHRTTLFGLPGNPVSCLVNAVEYVAPWIRRGLGMPRVFLAPLHAVALEPIRDRPGRAKLLRVTLERTADGLGARPTGSQSSGVLSSMGRAHGLLMRSSLEGGVEIGDRVEIQVIDSGFLLRELPGYPD